MEEWEDVDWWGISGFHDFGPIFHEGVEFDHVCCVGRWCSDPKDYIRSSASIPPFEGRPVEVTNVDS